MEQEREPDDDVAMGELRLYLHGGKVERRFVVVRERVRDGHDSVGRSPIAVPGRTFGVFVTSCAEVPEEIRRYYGKCADTENRVAESKHDLGGDDPYADPHFRCHSQLRQPPPGGPTAPSTSEFRLSEQ